jgi:predicted CoA-substrate-specific enzyme activase
MIVAGFDFGTAAAKVVLIRDGSILSSAICVNKTGPEQIAKEVIDKALSEANVSAEDINYCVSIGWGKRRVPFTHIEMSELPCLAKGAQWLIPSARTVIDIGGQNSRTLVVNGVGKILDYNLNDKCAAGMGRFFELIADALELKLEELSSIAFKSKNPVKITSQCCVFAESEVIALVNEGLDLSDIVAGVHDSTIRRLVATVGAIQITEDVVLTGGCAMNKRLVEGLGSLLRFQIKPLPVDPRLVGALGAALFAQEKASQN